MPAIRAVNERTATAGRKCYPDSAFHKRCFSRLPQEVYQFSFKSISTAKPSIFFVPRQGLPGTPCVAYSRYSTLVTVSPLGMMLS